MSTEEEQTELSVVEQCMHGTTATTLTTVKLIFKWHLGYSHSPTTYTLFATVATIFSTWICEKIPLPVTL
jgi:hypothetical protein